MSTSNPKYELIILHGQQDFADMVKLRILKIRGLSWVALGYPGGSTVRVFRTQEDESQNRSW